MSFGKLAALYGACAVVFLSIDLVWLTTMNSRFYRPRLGGLLSDRPNLSAAVVFYALNVVGIVMLAVVPGFRDGAVSGALWRGALLGLIAYATYDLTNLATLDSWPLDLTIVDLAWGTTVTGIVSVAGYYVAGWLRI